MTKDLISLAFHLPQFHEVPENNQWWGPGFTEWTHLRQARTWSGDHRIRRPISPLGEYCLTDPATLELQWEIASSHGISGFAVWDYWFGGGKQLLERPIELVLKEKLRFKYCLAWANHSWYDKSKNILLCEQKYLGADDYARYFDRACRHFESDNYIKIDGKPVFFIYNPHAVPDCSAFIDQWRTLAEKRGFAGMYFLGDGVSSGQSLAAELDKYSNAFGFLTRRNKLFLNYLKEHMSRRFSVELGPRRFDFSRLARHAIPQDAESRFAPTIFTGWDTTPRHGRRGVIYAGLDVGAFRGQLEAASAHFARFPDARPVLMLKSWNEWAEGNVLEPDSVYGFEFLTAFKVFAAQRERHLTDTLA
ncbi:MAG TPA: glycoside hydrolase family 99-like domain-containing protein [Burkholderiaceae bacterium]|nr:glycoside hydrolase family 99-like domain-containing protein [Burkholderiaceae bacterium]